MSPILDEHTVDLVSHSAEQTRRLGSRLAELLEGGEVICLVGDLGTGKTCLVQGIGAGLDVKDRITSPTFTLINEYRGGRLTLFLEVINVLDRENVRGYNYDLVGSGGRVWVDREVEAAFPMLPVLGVTYSLNM